MLYKDIARYPDCMGYGRWFCSELATTRLFEAAVQKAKQLLTTVPEQNKTSVGATRPPMQLQLLELEHPRISSPVKATPTWIPGFCFS